MKEMFARLILQEELKKVGLSVHHCCTRSLVPLAYVLFNSHICRRTTGENLMTRRRSQLVVENNTFSFICFNTYYWRNQCLCIMLKYLGYITLHSGPFNFLFCCPEHFLFRMVPESLMVDMLTNSFLPLCRRQHFFPYIF